MAKSMAVCCNLQRLQEEEKERDREPQTCIQRDRVFVCVCLRVCVMHMCAHRALIF